VSLFQWVCNSQFSLYPKSRYTYKTS
jgi:hypothetical protein